MPANFQITDTLDVFSVPNADDEFFVVPDDAFERPFDFPEFKRGNRDT